VIGRILLDIVVWGAVAALIAAFVAAATTEALGEPPRPGRRSSWAALSVWASWPFVAAAHLLVSRPLVADPTTAERGRRRGLVVHVVVLVILGALIGIGIAGRYLPG
jgi:hypothetical protein